MNTKKEKPQFAPLRMTWGFVLGFARRAYGRLAITDHELVSYSHSALGLEVFPGGLTLEAARYMLAQPIDDRVPVEFSDEGGALIKTDEASAG